MAGLTITVGGNDITDYVDVESISIEEVGTEIVATCNFVVRDHSGTVSISAKDSVDVDDDGTTIFAGEVARAEEGQEGIAKTWRVTCHDYNILLDETVIESESYAHGTSDADIIDDLFTNYRSDIDSTTHVSTLDASMEAVDYAGMSLREILDDLASRTGARYYIDYDKYLHWFDTEASSASFDLSTSPDFANSYPFGGFRRVRDGSRIADKVYVLGKEVSGWYPAGTPAYDGSERHAVSRDQRITTAQGVTDRGKAIYDRYNTESVTYRLWTEKDGLRAGMSVALVNETWDINDSFYIRRVRTEVIGKDGELRRHHLELNDEAPEPSRNARQLQQHIARVETEINSVGDTVYDTDAPSAPNALGAGNISTGVSEDADGKQIVWAEITWSEVTDSDLDHYELQLSTQADFSSDVTTRTHPAGGDRSERFAGLLGNTTYYVRVRATDWVGNDSDWDYGGGSAHSFTSAKDNSAPSDPTGVSAVATPVSVHLSWDANSEGDLAHYEIQRKPDGGAYSDLATCSLNFFIDNTVTIGTSYWYRVRAVDTSGNASNWVEIASSVSADQIQSGDLSDGAVLTDKLADNAVELAKIAEGAVDTDKLADNAVETAKLASGAVDTDSLANLAVELGKIADGAVDTDKLAANAVTAAKIFADTITANEIASDTITANEIAASTITASEIAAGTLTATEIAAGAIDTDELAANAVTTAKINAGAVTATEIAAGTITANEIASDTITANEIAASTITASQIAANTIGAGQIAADTITASEIAASTITATEMSVSQLSAIAADMGSITAGTVTGATIRTAASGARVVQDSTDGIRVFNASDVLTAQFDVDGSGQIGSSSYEPIVWNAAGEIDKIKANQIDLGDAGIFSEADGLLLLGPNCPITETSWTSLRGQEATISGAFHQVAGAWAGTKALMVEYGTTNLVDINPAFVGGENTGGSGNCTITRTTDDKVFGSHSQVLTFASGSGSGISTTYWKANAETMPYADTYSLTLYYKIVNDGGGTWKFKANGYHGGSTLTLIADGCWHRATSQVTTGGASRPEWHCIWNDSGTLSSDAVIRIDGLQTERRESPTSFCYGDLAWCSWSGTAHSSTSTRLATQVRANDAAGLISTNDTFTVSVWFQALYDYDDTLPSSYGRVFEAYYDSDNAIKILIDRSSNKVRAEVESGGSTAFVTPSSALQYSRGDWILVTLTVDFSSDDYNLYLNGESVASDSSSLSAPTLNQLNLGSSYSGGSIGAASYGELAIFDSILTPEEISALYQRNAPLVDTGAYDTPGIYILDGRFSLATSTSGARTEIDASGWRAWNSAGNAAFALALEDGLSWDGGTLDQNDMQIGRQADNYLLWDESAGTLEMKGSITLTNTIASGDISDVEAFDGSAASISDVASGADVTADNPQGSDWLTDVSDGTYAMVLSTEISSGHIKLTSDLVADGEWYDYSGVEIDAVNGINIYGTDAAFTTRATKGGTIQCKVDSDGAIVAGAGAIKLNATRQTITSSGDSGNYIRWVNEDVTSYGDMFAFANLQETDPTASTNGVFNVGIRHDANNQSNISFHLNQIDFFIQDGGNNRYVMQCTYDYLRLQSVPFRPGTGSSDPTASISDGMIFYRTDTDKMRLRAASAWRDLATEAYADGVDHGGLGGLGDDDHSQYHNDSRANTWHGNLSGAHVTNGDSHDHSGGDGGTIDHGALSGKGDDDHSQYHNDSRANTWHSGLSGSHVTNGNSHNHNGGDGGTIDHGALSGKGDDDHSQYFLASGGRAMSGDIDLNGNVIKNVDKVRLDDVGSSHPSDPSDGVFLYHIATAGGDNSVYVMWGDGKKLKIADYDDAS